MAGITVSGVGTGIDIASLVSQLVAAERDPAANRLNRREADYQAQLSGFGLLKSALADLQSKVSALDETNLFGARTVTSASEDVFTASASSGTTVGGYDIEVEQLATAHKLRSEGFTDEDAVVGTGALTLSLGGSSFDVVVDSGNETLAGIRDAINAAEDNPGISASIINVDDGDGGTESRLVLIGGTVGAANAITVTADDDDGNDTNENGLSQLVYDPSDKKNLKELQEADDAKIYVDGQLATRSSNSIDDVISGVTLSLVEADPGNEYRLTVAENTGKVTDAVGAFVSSFNAFVDTLSGLSSYSSETGSAGVLIGDAALRGIEFALRRELGSAIAGLAGDIDNMTRLGVTTGDGGKLGLDEAVLNTALADDPAGVQAFLANDGAFVDRLDTLLEGYTQSNGILDDRQDALTDRIDSIGDQRLTLDRRIQSLETRLLNQFSAMDALVAQLQSTGDFLTQQLQSLQSLTGRNNT